MGEKIPGMQTPVISHANIRVQLLRYHMLDLKKEKERKYNKIKRKT